MVNEDPTDKLIRELKEENERLKTRIKGGDVSEEELKDLAGKDAVSKDEPCVMFGVAKTTAMFGVANAL